MVCLLFLFEIQLLLYNFYTKYNFVYKVQFYIILTRIIKILPCKTIMSRYILAFFSATDVRKISIAKFLGYSFEWCIGLVWVIKCKNIRIRVWVPTTLPSAKWYNLCSGSLQKARLLGKIGPGGLKQPSGPIHWKPCLPFINEYVSGCYIQSHFWTTGALHHQYEAGQGWKCKFIGRWCKMNTLCKVK